MFFLRLPSRQPAHRILALVHDAYAQFPRQKMAALCTKRFLLTFAACLIIGRYAAGTYFVRDSQKGPIVASVANAPKFNISDVDADLPADSVALYQKPDFWKLYGKHVIVEVLLLAAETLLVLGLLWQRSKLRKVETELELINERLHLAVESGKSVGWDLDFPSGNLFWFGDLQTMFGIPSGTFHGSVGDFYRHVHPEDRRRVSEAVAHARQEHDPYAEEFRIVHPDGTIRWVVAKGHFYYAEDGEPLRMLGIATDITEHKQTEEKLQESQERLNSIVASAMDAIIVVDDELRVVVFNAAAEHMFCCAASDAIGSLVDRFIPYDFHSEYRKHATHFDLTGACAEAGHKPGVSWGVRTTGEEFPIEASISFHAALGKKLGTGIIRDITERLRAQEAIVESEQRFRLVADTAPVMIWMAGTDKLCYYFNKGWLDFVGRPIESQIGNGWTKEIHPLDLPTCFDTYVQSSDRHESFRMEYRLRRRDGEYRWVLDTGIPRFNVDGSFLGYIGSCIDVTDHKVASNALASLSGRLIETQEQERRRLARELHDDYNQRLALLAMDLEKAAESAVGAPAETRQLLHQLWNQTCELGADLHSLSHRLHSGTLEKLGLLAGINAFCTEFSQQKEIRVDFAHEDVPGNVPADVALCMFRILQEALRNVRKHSGVKHAEVRLRRVSEALHLSVSDQGNGFDPNNLPMQAGIGLRSMEERLRLLGGQLRIHSRPAMGTRIDAWLPLKAALSARA